MPPNAQLLYKNGDVYHGQLSKTSQQPSGQGTYKFKNGSVYQGQFLNGVFHGRGKLCDHFSSITIIANFQNGKVHGPGKIIYSDQSIYEGFLLKGVRHGKGRYIYSNKQEQSQYDGDFVDDMYQGRGTLRYKNGMIYSGKFKKDMFEGQGELKIFGKLHIVGDFMQGQPHGKCLIKYEETGQIYEGDMIQGEKHGFGTLTYQDGSRYKGHFKSGKRSGKGQLIFQDGSNFKGEFQNNQPIKGVLENSELQMQTGFKQQQFNGFYSLKKIIKSDPTYYTHIQGNYNQGQKEGIFTVKKTNSKGKEVIYKGQFKKGKQNPYSVSYSERF